MFWWQYPLHYVKHWQWTTYIPDASEIVIINCSVDDLLQSVDNVDEARRIALETETMLAFGGITVNVLLFLARNPDTMKFYILIWNLFLNQDQHKFKQWDGFQIVWVWWLAYPLTKTQKYLNWQIIVMYMNCWHRGWYLVRCLVFTTCLTCYFAQLSCNRSNANIIYIPITYIVWLHKALHHVVWTIITTSRVSDELWCCLFTQQTRPDIQSCTDILCM